MLLNTELGKHVYKGPQVLLGKLLKLVVAESSENITSQRFQGRRLSTFAQFVKTGLLEKIGRLPQSYGLIVILHRRHGAVDFDNNSK